MPAEGISPLQEFNRDTRGLIFLDTTVVSEAFLHHETRKLDNAGCFSFGDVKYEASTALANAEVEIAYDPMKNDGAGSGNIAISGCTGKEIQRRSQADGKRPFLW